MVRVLPLLPLTTVTSLSRNSLRSRPVSLTPDRCVETLLQNIFQVFLTAITLLLPN